MILKVKDENGHFKEVILKGTRGEKGEKGDSGTLYPLASYEYSSEVKDLTKPYGHVERYGAVADYESYKTSYNYTNGTDNTKAIQAAVDSVIRAGGGVVEFGTGNYRINGTIYVNSKYYNTVTIKGVDGKYIQCDTRYNCGSTILVKNTSGSIFVTNLNSDGSTYAEVDGASGGNYNVTIKNLYLITERKTYDVIGIKMFRTRINIAEIGAVGLSKVVEQSYSDSKNNINYCDFCTYRNINMFEIKSVGLDLAYPDSSIIECIYNSDYENTMEAAIKITSGSGFTIKNCINTWQLDNYASSVSDSKAFFKITGCSNFTIQDTYIERTYLANAIILSTCNAVKILNIHDKYAGNNLIKMYNCNGVGIDGIYRNIVLTANYYDIYFSGTNKNIDIRNCTFYKYDTGTERTIVFGGTYNKTELTGKTIQIHLFYDGSAWKITDGTTTTSSNVNTIIASGSFDGSGFSFETNSKVGKGIIKGVMPRFFSSSSLPYTPMQNHTVTHNVIYFMDGDSRITTPSNKMSCIVNVDIF